MFAAGRARGPRRGRRFERKFGMMYHGTLTRIYGMDIAIEAFGLRPEEKCPMRSCGFSAAARTKSLLGESRTPARFGVESEILGTFLRRDSSVVKLLRHRRAGHAAATCSWISHFPTNSRIHHQWGSGHLLAAEGIATTSAETRWPTSSPTIRGAVEQICAVSRQELRASTVCESEGGVCGHRVGVMKKRTWK